MTMRVYKQWKDALPEWQEKFNNSWPNFSVKEIAQRENHNHWINGLTPVLIVPSAMDRLQLLRNYCKFPLEITSGYRSPEYNNSISSTGLYGPHTTGRAFDIRCYGGQVNEVLYYAHKVGFTGIGVKQHGPYNERFIHVDDLNDNETEGKRPWTWSYK